MPAAEDPDTLVRRQGPAGFQAVLNAAGVDTRYTEIDAEHPTGLYFKDPAGTGKLAGTDKKGTDKTVPVGKDDMPKLKEELENT